jgi:pimeloyl-ACP methyl ester carboxylesterase/membrane protein DedA with SNARE-associated domain
MARRRYLPWLLGGYVVCLGASHAVRAVRPSGETPAADERVVAVTDPSGSPVRIAYRDGGTGDPPLILIHGSPGDNDEVSQLAERIGRTRRAIAPDLPGFGGSTWAVPDYSIRAHADYLRRLMDSLRIDRAHLLGFSMGGGVILELAAMAPDRVASITLLSAIGAQEYELLGNYHLNHAIHWIQWAGLRFLREATPHFGWLDGGFLTVEYARNFLDTDQRPLRATLGGFQGPALIIHGASDQLVDPAVATESARLMPQSELVMWRDPNATHFMAFQRADTLSAVTSAFLARVDRGEATTRPRAPPHRIAAAGLPFDPAGIPPATGIALAVLLLLIAASTLVSEDLACIATGLLVSRGTIGYGPGVIACLVGIFVGDLWLFAMGRWLGRPALRHAPLRWFVKEADVERISRWFDRRGAWLILATRFVPGTRLPTYFTAGVLHARVATFLGAFLLAAALWTPLLVGASALFGDRVLTAFTAYQALALPTIILIAFALYLIVKLVIPLFSWRGRRLLLSRWRRLTRWEFWPRWAFYPPIVAYVAWLSLKHRSLTLFTAVNPAIPGGGFVGESKAQILAGLAHRPDRVARWRLIPEGSVQERAGAVARFVADHHLAYPIVLKPDVGERGGGVGILEDDEAVRHYLAQTAEPLIAQEYVGGVEFGIFYYRIPGTARGEIFAITDKRFPTVVGDGQRSLETLILADDRAVSMAPFFLDLHAERLDWVPGPGESFRLVQLGTHSRGSAFYDGEWIRTPALEAAVDELSRGYQGFWFGRYDVRAPSAEALKAGAQFTVLELNGATAEATSIYDPKNRLGTAYRILRKQWSLLFEIAARNVAAGARPATVRELLGLIGRHRRALHAHVEAT